MRISMLKSAALAAATTLASAGLIVATSSAANAVTGCGVSIPSVNGGLVSVNASTQWLTLKVAPVVDPSLTSWYVDGVSVYRGGQLVGTTTDTFFDSPTSTIKFKFQNSWGRGPLTIGNIQITAFNSHATGSDPGEYTCNFSTPKPGIPNSPMANPTGGLVALSALAGNLTSYGTAFKINVRGTKHTFSVGAKYWTPAGTWHPRNGARVALQALSAGKWRTVKVLTLGPAGRATWVRYTSAKFRYRAIVPGTPTIAGGTSTFGVRY